MTSLGLIPRGVRFINLKFEQLANSNLNQLENILTFGQVGSKKNEGKKSRWSVPSKVKSNDFSVFRQ